jgi:hypothetical protein
VVCLVVLIVRRHVICNQWQQQQAAFGRTEAPSSFTPKEQQEHFHGLPVPRHSVAERSKGQCEDRARAQ